MSAQASTVLSKHDHLMVTLDIEPNGLATITMNDTHETFNTITRRFGEELRDAFDRVARDPHIRAVVLVSGKPDSFVVGANIDMIRDIKLASEAERLSSLIASGLRQMRAGEKPVVAAVHGQALGGGFEIALACHAIVASDDEKTVFGLPEVKLGLVAAANGMMRIAERAGLEVALDLSLSGRNIRAATAKAMGLVDEVCPRALLEGVARAKALALCGKLSRRRSPSRRAGLKRKLRGLALEKTKLGRAMLFKKVRAETRNKTHGQYPAAERIVDVLECFGARGFDAAAELEAKSFGELTVSETAHRLIETFFAQTALKKDPGVSDRATSARTIERVGVVDAGPMGAGIAYLASFAGMTVRMKDTEDLAIGYGMKTVRELLDARVKKEQMTPEAREQTFALLSGTTDLSGFRHADIVIEAVFEDLARKQRVLAEIESVTSESCIFASSTSRIPIREIAKASKRPENVIGMHYFAPVEKTPLLEVVQTERTAKDVVVTCVALGKKQGKAVIVVNDGPGFYTTRILAPFMNEAVQLLIEGVPIEAIDGALVSWGWPVGPLQLLDETGIDVAAHTAPILTEAFGVRMAPPMAIEQLVRAGRKGRKNGRGFYRYDGRRRAFDTTVYDALGVMPGAAPPMEEIQMRCSLQLVNEALRAYGDGIVRSTRDADIGAILGVGFPPFRGGPLRYVDTVGAAELLRRIRAYEDRFGPRWSPAPVLVELEKTVKRLYT